MSGGTTRRLAKCHNIDDLRRAAKRRLPYPVFDFLDGGAEDERTLRRNRSGFDRHLLAPHVFRDVSEVDTATTVLGAPVKVPVIVAPTGMPALFHHSGEDSLVPAAARNGAIFATSNMASRSIEEVAALSQGPKWFQLYVWKDRAMIEDFVARCRNAGYDALCVTVDLPITGNRERDRRNRLAFQLRPTLGGLADTLRKPGWLWNFKTNRAPLPANLAGHVSSTNLGELSRFSETQMTQALTWDTADWLRGIWPGKLAIKGVLRADDAKRAAEAGFDAIVVSNHGNIGLFLQ